MYSDKVSSSSSELMETWKRLPVALLPSKDMIFQQCKRGRFTLQMPCMTDIEIGFSISSCNSLTLQTITIFLGTVNAQNKILWGIPIHLLSMSKLRKWPKALPEIVQPWFTTHFTASKNEGSVFPFEYFFYTLRWSFQRIKGITFEFVIVCDTAGYPLFRHVTLVSIKAFLFNKRRQLYSWHHIVISSVSLRKLEDNL